MAVPIAKTSWTVRDDVCILTDQNGYKEFSIGQISEIENSNVQITWYYRGISPDIENTEQFKSFHPDDIPLHRILLFHPGYTDWVPMGSINNRVFIAKDVKTYQHYKQHKWPFHFLCKFYDAGDTIERWQPSDEESTDDEDDDKESYVPPTTDTHMLASQYENDRNSRIKRRRANKTTISLLSSSDDDHTDSTPKHAKQSQMQHTSTKSVTSTTKSNPSSKKKQMYIGYRYKKSKKSKKRAKQSHKGKKKSRKTYDELLKCPIEQNRKYLASKTSDNKYPYPCKESDHQSSPTELLCYMFYILKYFYNYEGNVLDVAPYQSPIDYCNHKLWPNEPFHQALYINPPWSCPYYYIAEAIKYCNGVGNTSDAVYHDLKDAAIVVLCIANATNTQYWKHLIAPYASLKMDLGHVSFGQHTRQVPYPCSLLFITTCTPKDDEFRLGQFGLCDLEEWSEKTKTNDKVWAALNDKLKYNFLTIGETVDIAETIDIEDGVQTRLPQKRKCPVISANKKRKRLRL